MKRILMVEDSAVVRKVLRHLALQHLYAKVEFAESFKEVKEKLAQHAYALALVDLTLPDAPDGEAAELIIEKGIPTVVLTGSIDEFRRQQLIELGVIDYVIKENRDSYLYAVRLLGQLLRNQGMKALVVDDSSVSRSYISDMLKRQLFDVIECRDGQQALEVVVSDPEIRLMLTDYAMPKMDGLELVKAVRNKRGREDLAIIGISGADQRGLSVKFIKHGANDFLTKPFINEEFHCRVMLTVEQLNLINEIKERGYRDYLTNLYNRRYLYSYAKNLHNDGDKDVVFAIFDVDHFKKINDTYGHQAGDKVLVELASAMQEAFSEQLCVRLGGEEFAVMFVETLFDDVMQRLEAFRIQLATQPIEIQGEQVPVTVSIGVAEQGSLNLDQVMNYADEALYKAKSDGRNRLVLHR